MEIGLIQIIGTIVATCLFGGGSGGILYWYLRKTDQSHKHKMDISDRFKNRLDKVEDNLEDTKQEVDRLKERETELVYKINVLLDRISLLVNKLDDYDELSKTEKANLKQVPEYKS